MSDALTALAGDSDTTETLRKALAANPNRDRDGPLLKALLDPYKPLVAAMAQQLHVSGPTLLTQCVVVSLLLACLLLSISNFFHFSVGGMAQAIDYTLPSY